MEGKWACTIKSTDMVAVYCAFRFIKAFEKYTNINEGIEKVSTFWPSYNKKKNLKSVSFNRNEPLGHKSAHIADETPVYIHWILYVYINTWSCL